MSTLENAAEVRDLVVRYGRRTAVDGVTLSVPRGSVYALLGRNGAGKSSLVRCMLGQQRASAGTVRVLGADVWKKRTSLMNQIGIVSEEADAPPQMTVGQIAAFFAATYSNWEQRSFDERISRLAIEPRSRFAALSKGEKRQVSLALSLATSPQLLVLDDPTLGLDVVARKTLFEELIVELADRGTTVFITTHDLAGIEPIADRVAVMHHGRLLIEEDLEQLKSRFRRVRSSTAVAVAAGGNSRVRPWGVGSEMIITNYDPGSPSSSIPGSAEVAAMSLEEIFLALAGEGEES